MSKRVCYVSTILRSFTFHLKTTMLNCQNNCLQDLQEDPRTVQLFFFCMCVQEKKFLYITYNTHYIRYLFSAQSLAIQDFSNMSIFQGGTGPKKQAQCIHALFLSTPLGLEKQSRGLQTTVQPTVVWSRPLCIYTQIPLKFQP